MAKSDAGKVKSTVAYEQRSLMRYSIVGMVVMALFLVGYFILLGPLYLQQPAYAPDGGNSELRTNAAPSPAP
jgi:hypothetical protein